jgi:CHASE3 domain sensor protein
MEFLIFLGLVIAGLVVLIVVAAIFIAALEVRDERREERAKRKIDFH